MKGKYLKGIIITAALCAISFATACGASSIESGVENLIDTVIDEVVASGSENFEDSEKVTIKFISPTP
ncbi:MAG: hypothetical protein K6B75_07435, partial [Lachnospiraceae bacterium]|nr:hypothetical protein [Lachnospiraceae bacterium]